MKKQESVLGLVVMGTIIGAGVYFLTREQNRRLINEKLTELGFKDTAQNISQTVSKGIANTAEAMQTDGSLKDKAEATAQAAKEAVSTVTESVKQGAEDAKLAGMIIADGIKAAAENVKDEVVLNGMIAVEEAREHISNIQDATENKIEEIKENANEIKGTLAEKAQEVTQEVKEQVEEKAQEVKDNVQEIKENAEEQLIQDSEKELKAKEESNRTSWPYGNTNNNERKF